MASTDKEEIFIPIIEKNFSKEMYENINFFHLRGGIDYKKLGVIHKLMMRMLKFTVSKKNPKELSNEDREFLATYGTEVNFTNKDTILPLLSALKD